MTKEAEVAGAVAKETQVAAVGEAAGGTPKVVASEAIVKVKTPYQIAKEGGRHSGLLKNYTGKAPEEIRKGIASIEKQVALHKDKIQNPDKYIPDFMKLDIRQQQALLRSKWPSDIERLTEQIDVLKGLLRE